MGHAWTCGVSCCSASSVSSFPSRDRSLCPPSCLAPQRELHPLTTPVGPALPRIPAAPRRAPDEGGAFVVLGLLSCEDLGVSIGGSLSPCGKSHLECE